MWNSFQSLYWVGRVSRAAKLATLLLAAAVFFRVISWKISDWLEGRVLWGAGQRGLGGGHLGIGLCRGSLESLASNERAENAHSTDCMGISKQMFIFPFAINV